MTKKWAWAEPGTVRPDDFTVEWDNGHSSVGMMGESEAKMWAAHMNEAYEAGRRAHEPGEFQHVSMGRCSIHGMWKSRQGATCPICAENRGDSR